MPDLSIELAEEAMAYVEEALPLGATNKREDIKRRKKEGMVLPYPNIGIYRAFQHALLYRDDPQGYPYEEGKDVFSENPSHNVLNILWQARCAEKAKMGDCQEQAAVAFRYLVEEKCVSGVAYYGIEGHGVSHAFVVLGFHTSPSVVRGYVNRCHPPASYPPDAVCCDPWSRECYKVYADWERKISDLICRFSKDGEMRHTYQLRCIAYHHSDLGDWV